VVLEKDRENGWTDRIKHEEVLQSQGGKEYSTYNETGGLISVLTYCVGTVF